MDDRDLRPGVMFAEADLVGIPHRVVISPRHGLNRDGWNTATGATSTRRKMWR